MTDAPERVWVNVSVWPLTNEWAYQDVGGVEGADNGDRPMTENQEAEAYAKELEAKLGRAEWLLCDAMVQLRDGKIRTRRNRAGLIEAFLEELKGQNQ